MNRYTLRTMVAALSVLTVTACTSIPKDGGVKNVESLLGDKLTVGAELPVDGEENQFTVQEIEHMIARTADTHRC